MSLAGVLSGLLFLVNLVGFGMIVVWALMFDAKSADGGEGGFFAMKGEDDYFASNPKADRRGWHTKPPQLR